MKKILFLAPLLLPPVCFILGYMAGQKDSLNPTDQIVSQPVVVTEVIPEPVSKPEPLRVVEPAEPVEEPPMTVVEAIPVEERAKQRYVTLTDTKERAIVVEIVDVTEDSLKVIREMELREMVIPTSMLVEADQSFARYLYEQKLLKLAAEPVEEIQVRSGSQVLVSSLKELLPYLGKDDVAVKLAPGTYTVREEDARRGAFPGSTQMGDREVKSILLFAGNNSTYDFTDVTMKVETGVFTAGFGNFEVFQVHVIGNKNVIKNLTMIDVGTVDDFPQRGCVNIVMDGARNRIEGFHVTSTGSKPYGYGDSFGKGGRNNVIRHKKHSTFLIRGLYNHAKDCTLIHRTYGHCMFMQAASYPTIEGCYVEGEMRSTDDMLNEKGSGSAADNVDFMTTWGYTLPKGYMMSTGEAGIRAYNAGTTIIDGEIIQRGTDNPTVINCTVKNMRTGVTLAHATGKKYVEGCTVIGCEQAFAIGSGSVVDCYADAAYGPVYKGTYERDSNTEVEITILPAETYYNGSKCLAYISGRNHKFIFRSGGSEINEELKIQVGGYYDGLRVREDSNPSQNNHTATDIEIENYTDYPVILSAKSSNITGKSKGRVEDEGSNNQLR
ncbi:MAG: hypothetical protein ACSHYA_17515 [Opitutaceae bacterium]